MYNQKSNSVYFLKNRFFCLLLGLFLIFILLVPHVEASKMSTAGMAKEIDRFLKKNFKSGEPGVAVLAVLNHKVVLRKGYGMGDLEHGVSLSPKHVFRIGSITKQFTAAAIMMLVDEGKLKVSDPLTKYLEDYPTHGYTITIEHLLNHTSGIKSYTSMPSFWQDKTRLDMSVEQLIDCFKKEPMDFPPGERYLYNNSGYILLGAIIEKVSGKSYPEFIQERIFKPLGMKNSYYGSHLTIIPNRASGYQKSKQGFTHCDFLSMKLPYAAGSLLSTVDDLYAWNQALLSGKVVSKKSFQKMITPTQLLSGKTRNYGYGLSVAEFFGVQSIDHGGGIHGFSTFALQIPEKKIFVAVLNNCPGMEPSPEYTAQWIAALLMGKPLLEKKPVKVAADILKSYVGIYRIDKADYREVIKQGDQLFTVRTGGPKFPIYAESDSSFFYKMSLSRLSFVRDKNGQVVKMVMHRPSGDEEAIRVDKREEKKVSPFAEYVGEYGEKDGFKTKIFESGGKLKLQGSGQPAVEIVSEKQDGFINKDMGIRLEFRRDKKGKVVGFYLFQRGLKIVMDRN
jgi:CubicO group peptidase (beta-lactamase class C family)